MVRHPPRLTRVPSTSPFRRGARHEVDGVLEAARLEVGRAGAELRLEVVGRLARLLGRLLRLGQKPLPVGPALHARVDRKSTRLNSSHANISYAVFCLQKKA